MTVDNNVPLGHNGAMHTVVETRHYVTRAQKLLTETERDKIIESIAADPLKGGVLAGTGGIRKLRFGKGDKGKSGGVRLVYYYNKNAPVFLLEIFGKNEKINLSKAERNALAKIAAVMKREIMETEYA